jgi:hypothetical protein
LTFNLDFEQHGLMLPVMPEAWKHYVPIDLSDPKATIERLLDERARWPEVAANGRVWARTHFLILVEEIVHLPKLSLHRRRFCGFGRGFRKGVSVGQGKIPEDETQARPPAIAPLSWRMSSNYPQAPWYVARSGKLGSWFGARHQSRQRSRSSR